MNNITFGNDLFQYYETIAGGAGAGFCFPGQDAVHTHMTNTQITDPEVLEWRYPVLLKEFSILKESGGNGKYCGGNGVKREIEFFENMVVSLITERRVSAPYGMNDGEPGLRGKNYLKRNGLLNELPGKCSFTVKKSNSIIIETPGGGGFGEISE